MLNENLTATTDDLEKAKFHKRQTARDWSHFFRMNIWSIKQQNKCDEIHFGHINSKAAQKAF